MIGNCISRDEVVRMAAKKEIVRRYFNEMVSYKMGITDYEIPEKIKSLMNEMEINEDLIKCRKAAIKKSEEDNVPAIAIEIGKKIITGKETNLLSAPSALVINTMKYLSKIPDNIDLLSPSVLKPILDLKGKKRSPLQLQEVLIALSICSVTNPIVGDALSKLDKLRDCEAHSSYIITNGDLKALKDLKIRLTCEPKFYSDHMYLD